MITKLQQFKELLLSNEDKACRFDVCYPNWPDDSIGPLCCALGLMGHILDIPENRNYVSFVGNAPGAVSVSIANDRPSYSTSPYLRVFEALEAGYLEEVEAYLEEQDADQLYGDTE